MSGLEDKERATVLDRLAKALFPTKHLSPWMGILSKPEAAGIAGARTIADLADEIDRRDYLDKHPGRKLPPEMQRARDKSLGDRDSKDLGGPETFDRALTRGAAGIFGYGLRSFASNIHDLNPSINGVGRRQALAISVSQRTGTAIEPKARSKLEILTNRGKDKEQLRGMD